jgi:hypothetical protein
MEKNRARTVRTLICGAVLGLIAITSLSPTSEAETGSISLVITKGGFILGAGGGRGILTFRGHHYRFRVSGISVGATIGASTTKLVGRALRAPLTARLFGKTGAEFLSRRDAAGDSGDCTTSD